MHKPTVNALIATVLALGEASGSATLQRAGGLLRHLIADGVVDPETESILHSVLIGIDNTPNSEPINMLFDELAIVH
jgi:hypothetical protein